MLDFVYKKLIAFDSVLFSLVNINIMADSTDPKPATAPVVDDSTTTNAAESSGEPQGESHSDRKRKRFQDDGLKFGRGGKKRDLGRNAWSSADRQQR